MRHPGGVLINRNYTWLWIGQAVSLVGDFVFGERPAGIPMAPWWAYAGLGLNSGGGLERTLRRTWPLLLVWQVGVFRGGAPWPPDWPGFGPLLRGGPPA